MSKASSLSAPPSGAAIIDHTQQAFKLALSMVLFYLLALWTNWDEPQYGGLAIVVVSLSTTGATLEKGIMRILGTTIGVAVGLLILGLFNHDRWAVVLVFMCYITFIGYLMQASRYSYAWYAAAFIPLVVWGDNYPQFESAFYFGTFRYLETTAGVLIYTMVDLVFWPRSAGDQLCRDGRELWNGIGRLFENDRRQLTDTAIAEEGATLRAEVARSLAQTESTLQQAYLDTAEVRHRKHEWELWRVKLLVLADTLEQWSVDLQDCSGLDFDRLTPQLETDCDRLGVRLARCAALWEEIHADGANTSDADDSLLNEKLVLELDHSAIAELPPDDCAALTRFLDRLEKLDRVSGEVLQTERALAGLATERDLRESSAEQDRIHTSTWDSARFLRALYPPVAFLAAFLIWVFINPPTGVKVPMMTGVIALAILRTPMNPVGVLAAMLLSALFVVAPVYWLVMPALETGFGLLALVFAYSFVFGYLGGRSPVLKAGPMIMFVNAIGISNQQTYSFQGIVDGALLILLAGAIVTSVYFLFKAIRLN